MAFIEISALSKSFGTGTSARHVLDEVTLSVERGEFVSIVGFMGCGKSTLLNIIAGLVTADAGEVRFGGDLMRGMSRDASIVFQNYSLLPWFSALENVRLAVAAAFPDWPRGRQTDHASRHLERVGLGSALHRRPGQLSGGMRQRVAIARAFATEPTILFLDEPFGALDALTRANLQQDLAELCSAAERQVTTIMITNSVEEALLLSDRIVPMTRAPRATLGAPVAVAMARPRTAATLLHDEHAIRIRAHVVGSLTASLNQAPRRNPSARRVHLETGRAPAAAFALRASAPGEAGHYRDLDAVPDSERGMTTRGHVPLELDGLTKTFPSESGPPVAAVENVNALVYDAEFVCILGHSGCGKSTVLSMIAGLQEATLGGVIIDGRQVTTPGSDRAVVFQSPCLLPWLTARQNVALAMKHGRPRLTRAERRSEADHYLELVGVFECADQLPGELSLGTQQCVSLARALSISPRFLLLDEPFSMLDSLTRFDMQDMLLNVWEQNRKIVVMVTHDVDEALYLADRLILMTDGPGAHVGEILSVPFPRPRERTAVLEHPEYYHCHKRVIDFLENHARQSKVM